MPNTIAYLALFSWPIVALVLFRLLPLQKALVWAIVGGHLLLPSATYIKLPMLPAIDKTLVTAVSALLLCATFGPRETASRDLSARTGRQIVLGLVTLVVVSPILTVLQNTEPVIDGRVFLPGLRLYDSFGLISQVLVSLIPFWLGFRYLHSRDGHRAILEALALGGLIYTFPVLFEVRISPQLHNWIYGFFPHEFAQHIRAGGFRPVVFLSHGLMVGIFLCIAVIASIALFREARREGRTAYGWVFAAAWLMIALFLSKNLGALMIAAGFAGATFFLGRRPQVALAVTVAAIVMFYPMLRGAGWIPVDEVHSYVLSINEDRAGSLKFRLDNEDALLDHANQKPLAGWGGWGRHALFDPETGEMTSTTDGTWIGLIGVFGWLGYVGRFGLLTIPILFFALRRKTSEPSYLVPGLIMVLCAALVDLLPNSGLVNYVWLMAGAVTGYVLWRDQSATEGTKDAQASQPSEGFLFAEPERATWLMQDEARQQKRRSRSADHPGSAR
ncbi:hypothetical protein [Tabrizicola sp.]|uniref:hypothetical protein n=1 Tax=Tabrizicola sp. TaxID=2005166 RepID=UPI003F2A1C54